jgi:hypothetical protein
LRRTTSLDKKARSRILAAVTGWSAIYRMVRRQILDIVACACIFGACATAAPRKSAEFSEAAAATNVPVKYGKLQVVAGHLSDSAGRPVQLRGMSTHGLQ